MTPIAWATLIAGTNDGVVVVDHEGRVVAANPAAQALTGWSLRHAVGRRWDAGHELRTP